MNRKPIETPTTLDLRDQLKAIVASEFQRMPALFEEMETKDRMAVVCRLIPYLFPRVDNIHHTDGESEPW